MPLEESVDHFGKSVLELFLEETEDVGLYGVEYNLIRNETGGASTVFSKRYDGRVLMISIMPDISGNAKISVGTAPDEIMDEGETRRQFSILIERRKNEKNLLLTSAVMFVPRSSFLSISVDLNVDQINRLLDLLVHIFTTPNIQKEPDLLSKLLDSFVK